MCSWEDMGIDHIFVRHAFYQAAYDYFLAASDFFFFPRPHLPLLRLSLSMPQPGSVASLAAGAPKPNRFALCPREQCSEQTPLAIEAGHERGLICKPSRSIRRNAWAGALQHTVKTKTWQLRDMDLERCKICITDSTLMGNPVAKKRAKDHLRILHSLERDIEAYVWREDVHCWAKLYVLTIEIVLLLNNLIYQLNQQFERYRSYGWIGHNRQTSQSHWKP